VRLGFLTASDAGPTWCEFKGRARYLDAIVAGQRAQAVAWSYPAPSAGYEALRDHVAFYPGRVDAAWLDDERAHAQPGDLYGGWITAIWSARSKARPAPAAGSDRRDDPRIGQCDPAIALIGLESAPGERTDLRLT
jgi:hypothetical protein